MFIVDDSLFMNSGSVRYDISKSITVNTSLSHVTANGFYLDNSYTSLFSVQRDDSKEYEFSMIYNKQ